MFAAALTLLCAVRCRDEYTDDRDFYRTESALTQVPDDIPDDAKEVYLSNNAISTLSAGAFSGLSQCTDLDLTDNSISTIDEGAFTGKKRVYWLFVRVSLVVAFGCLPQNIGRWRGPANHLFA